MIDALISRDNEYFYGTRYKTKRDIVEKNPDGTIKSKTASGTQGDFFQYEILESRRRSYGTIINNLIATQGRFTIKTNWDLNFRPKEYIVDNNGTRWQIAEVQKLREEANPNVNAILKENPDTDYILSLVEVDNVENAQ